MPIQRQVTETVTHTLTLLTLQEYADQIVPEPYKQPLKTLDEALRVHGWDRDPMPDDYCPECCGKPVEIVSFLGGPYQAACKVCGRFVIDVTGPQFGNSYVSVVDSKKVDLETDFGHRWIAGKKED